MSVVVRMEMPRCCTECTVRYICAPYTGCLFGIRELPTPYEEDCHILAVLPEKHGELIDRQVVYEKIKWWQENTHDTVTKAMLHEFYLMLFGVPAIVPAERSET